MLISCRLCGYAVVKPKSPLRRRWFSCGIRVVSNFIGKFCLKGGWRAGTKDY